MLLAYLDNPLLLFSWIAALIIAISVHEFAHALAADKLGDLTPRYQGRLTLNPLVHLDLLGTIFILFASFGWGKPVQFNPWNLKNPKRDSAIISLAGPFSNLLTASLLSLLFRALPPPGNLFLVPIIVLNINLSFFNLIPIAPLDGFRVVGGLIPSSLSHQWQSLERYGFLILLFLIFPLFGRPILSLILLPLIRETLTLLLGKPLAFF